MILYEITLVFKQTMTYFVDHILGFKGHNYFSFTTDVGGFTVI